MLQFEPFTSIPIARSENPSDKAVILGPGGKITASTEKQSLVDSFLYSVMGLLDITVLVRSASVIFCGRDSVMAHERRVVSPKLFLVLASKISRTQMIGPVSFRTAAESP